MVSVVRSQKPSCATVRQLLPATWNGWRNRPNKWFHCIPDERPTTWGPSVTPLPAKWRSVACWPWSYPTQPQRLVWFEKRCWCRRRSFSFSFCLVKSIAAVVGPEWFCQRPTCLKWGSLWSCAGGGGSHRRGYRNWIEVVAAKTGDRWPMGIDNPSTLTNLKKNHYHYRVGVYMYYVCNHPSTFIYMYDVCHVCSTCTVMCNACALM